MQKATYLEPTIIKQQLYQLYMTAHYVHQGLLYNKVIKMINKY